MLDQQQTDAESVFTTRRDMEKHDERLKALELIVFKDASVATLIDDMRLRIEEGEAAVRKEIAEVRDSGENRYEDMKQQLFKIDGRITSNEVLKEQFEMFHLKQEKFDSQWISYKEEVKKQFNANKDQFNNEYKKLIDELTHVKQDL